MTPHSDLGSPLSSATREFVLSPTHSSNAHVPSHSVYLLPGEANSKPSEDETVGEVWVVFAVSEPTACFDTFDVLMSASSHPRSW